MKSEQFQREKAYGAGISIAKGLLTQGHITKHEYRQLKAALIQKHRPLIYSLAVPYIPAPVELTQTAAITKKKGA